MHIDVIVGVPGCGKSHKIISESAITHGRYLFSLPTIDLIEEQAVRFRSLNSKAHCLQVHSRSTARGNVSRQIGDLASFGRGHHVVAMVTHEALMSTDLSGFHGWHARIDEPPNSLMGGQINLSASIAAFKNDFTLEPVSGSNWSQLRPLHLGITWTAYAKDTLWRELTDFRKLAARPQGVCVNLCDWSEARQGPVQWLSLWTPWQLKAFETVTLAGAGILTSLGFNRLLKKW